MQGDFNPTDASTGFEETRDQPGGIVSDEIEVDEQLEEETDYLADDDTNDDDEEFDEEDDLEDEDLDDELERDDVPPAHSVVEPAQAPVPAVVVSPWNCSICAEPSQSICLFCTKDTCDNHLCLRCGRCSDCCACDLSRVM